MESDCSCLIDAPGQSANADEPEEEVDYDLGRARGCDKHLPELLSL